MNRQDYLVLAQAWISRYETVHRFGDDAPEALATYSAYLAVDRLACAQPEDAWHVILQVLEMTDNEFVLENLAAGSLETLLGRHGDSFIERLEARAAADPKFRWLVAGVWQGRMSKDLWTRVQAAGGTPSA